jgi:cytoskeletal protein CcmA (bactofilin family)
MPDATLQSFLDSGTSFDGKITFTGTIRLDGAFKGEASADGTLVIGETAEVDAHLSVRTAVIHGQVRGDVIARDLIEVGPTARIHGSLKTQRLRVAEGARIDAKIEMVRDANPAPRALT